MRYNWKEINYTYNGESRTEYNLDFPYQDGSPCYDSASAKISLEPKYSGYTHAYLRGQGLDPTEKTWHGEVGATNYMAESLANGWDCFFRFDDDDIDDVFAEVEVYLDNLMASGNVKQEWIDENVG